MSPTNDEFHCFACNAAVSEREILDGWCDSCGKRLPASFEEAVRRAQKSTPTPVSVDLTDSAPVTLRRRLLVGGVVLGVLVGLAVLFVLTGGG
jgi:hypothetical protein